MNNVTTLSPSDRNRRMASYSLSMLIRLVCIGLCFVIQGWWLILPILGAIVLPWFAVVSANNKTEAKGQVENPYKPIVLLDQNRR